MASDTDVANRAMRLLKANRIASLTDGTKNGNVAIDVFTEVRESLLRGHKWKFNKLFVELSRHATAPTFKYDHAYVLPSNWLRTYSLHDNDIGRGSVDFEEGEIEGVGVLLCSIENAFLKYGYTLVDPNRMSADFRTAFAYALAEAMPGISNISGPAWIDLKKDAKDKLRGAKSSDALGQPPDRRPAGSWAATRRSWPSSRWPR